MGKISKYLKENEERTALILLFSAIFIFAMIRLPLTWMPLERDEGGYAYGAWLLLSGKGQLYVDMYSMRYPGVFLFYGLIISIFGDTHKDIHIALIFVNTINTAFVYLIGKRLTKPYFGFIAALFYLTASIVPFFNGLQTQNQQFVMILALPAIYLILKHIQGDGTNKEIYLAGFLLGLSFLTKHHGVFFFLFAITATSFHNYFILNNKNIKGVLTEPLQLLTGFLAAYLTIVLYTAYNGTLAMMFYWTLIVTKDYVTSTSIDSAITNFMHSVNIRFPYIVLITTLSIMGTVTLIKNTVNKNKDSSFLLLFVIFSTLSIMPGFYFRGHYFQQIFPALAISSSYFLYRLYNLPSINKNSYSTVLVLIVGTLAFSQSLYAQKNLLFVLEPEELTPIVYSINPFNESLDVASYIQQNSTEKDTIIVLASEPEIAFYAKRKFATAHVHSYNMLAHNDTAKEMKLEFLNDIFTKKPLYIIATNINLSGPLTSTYNSPITRDYTITHYMETGVDSPLKIYNADEFNTLINEKKLFYLLYKRTDMLGI